MLNFAVLIICLIVCAVLAAWGRPRDAVAVGLGLACGVALAFAINERTAWYLLALVAFIPLIVWRRRSSRPQT